MNDNFLIRRVLVLSGLVVFLAVVYLLVRSEFLDTGSGNLVNLTGPAETVQTWEYHDKYWGESQYLVLEDPKDLVSVNARAAVELALECLGQQPVYLSDPQTRDITGDYAGIIVTATHLNKMGVLDALFEYAENGGLLIFAVRPEVDEMFKSIYQQLGIFEHFYFADTEAIRFVPGIYGDSELTLGNDGIYNSAIELHVREECQVMAVSEGDIPLIWSLPYGGGNILVMNNSLMLYKSTGGLLLSLMANIQGPLLYPVINGKVFALEAFPLPANVNQDFIKSNYLRTGRTFLRDLWWPAMVQLQTACNITYTAGFMTGYEREEAFAGDELLMEEMDFSYYGKELARYEGELAFTGFNQMPLYFGELGEQMQFIPWSSAAKAEAGNRNSLRFFQRFYPKYQLYTYLPPERMLDQQGYEMIKELMPGLTAVCGDFSDKERWIQNFEVAEDGIVSFPVVTAGFTVNDRMRYDQLNTATARGVLFHSCDVSDLLLEQDETRNWNRLSVAFGEFISDSYGTSVFDSLTVAQAAGRVKVMQSLEPEITYYNDRIQVRINSGGAEVSFLLLCFGKEPQNSPGVTCTKIHDAQYLITTSKEEFSVELKDL